MVLVREGRRTDKGFGPSVDEHGQRDQSDSGDDVREHRRPCLSVGINPDTAAMLQDDEA